jgi:hypothetical protein
MKLRIRCMEQAPDISLIERGGNVEIVIKLTKAVGDYFHPCDLQVLPTGPNEQLVPYGRTLIVGPRGGLSLSPP